MRIVSVENIEMVGKEVGRNLLERQKNGNKGLKFRRS